MDLNKCKLQPHSKEETKNTLKESLANKRWRERNPDLVKENKPIYYEKTVNQSQQRNERIIKQSRQRTHILAETENGTNKN